MILTLVISFIFACIGTYLLALRGKMPHPKGRCSCCGNSLDGKIKGID